MMRCWTDREEWLEATYGPLSDEYLDVHATAVLNNSPHEICMLEAGHEGPHQWVPDDQIVIRFGGE